MTDEEIRHTNVLLEDIKQQVQLVFEGHQVLDAKIDRVDRKLDVTRQELGEKLDGISGEVQSLRGILAKLTDLMDDHDKWLRDHGLFGRGAREV